MISRKEGIPVKNRINILLTVIIIVFMCFQTLRRGDPSIPALMEIAPRLQQLNYAAVCMTAIPIALLCLKLRDIYRQRRNLRFNLLTCKEEIVLLTIVVLTSIFSYGWKLGKIWIALFLSAAYILLLVAEKKWKRGAEKDFYIERKSEQPCKRLNAVVYAYIFALYFFLLFFFLQPYISGTEKVTVFLKGYNLFAFSANAIWAALFYCEIYRPTERAAIKSGKGIAMWSAVCFLSAFLGLYVPFGYWWAPILLIGVYVWIALRRYRL